MSGLTIDLKDAMDVYVEIAKGMKLDAWDTQQYYSMATITMGKMNTYLESKNVIIDGQRSKYSDLSQKEKENYQIQFLQEFIKNISKIATKRIEGADGESKPLVNVPSALINLALGAASYFPAKIKNGLENALSEQTATNLAMSPPAMAVPSFVADCVIAIILSKSAAALLIAIKLGHEESMLATPSKPESSQQSRESSNSVDASVTSSTEERGPVVDFNSLESLAKFLDVTIIPGDDGKSEMYFSSDDGADPESRALLMQAIEAFEKIYAAKEVANFGAKSSAAKKPSLFERLKSMSQK